MKTCIYSTIFFLLIATSVFAQIVNGETKEFSEPDENQPQILKDKDDVFDNAFYFKLGLSSPRGVFGKRASVSYPSELIVQSFANGLYGGLGAKRGYTLGMGTIFYFKNMPTEKYKAGIDVTFLDATYHSIDWSDAWGFGSESDNIPFLSAGMKIGPAFSYNPIDALIIDAYYKVSPTTGFFFPANEEAYDWYDANVATINHGFSFGLRHSLGFNLRYKAFLFNVDCNFGKLKFFNTHYRYKDSAGNRYDYNFEPESPTQMLQISIGVKG